MAYFLGKGTDAVVTPGRPQETQATTPAAVGEGAPDPACMQACREENLNCKREAKARGDEYSIQECETRLRECLAECERRSPPSPEEKVIACINGRCMEVAITVASQEQINACSGMTAGTECGEPPPDEYELGCSPRGICRKVPVGRGSANCLGKNIGDECERDVIGCEGGYELTDPKAGCPSGYVEKSIEGQRWCCPVATELACQEGICVQVGQGKGDTACAGLSEGDACDVQPDLACEDGVCVEVPAGSGDTACAGLNLGDACGGNGNGNGEEEGCEGGYLKGDAPFCAQGYEVQGIEGEAWCCPTDVVPLGEWEWPAEMKEFYDMLLGYGKDIMGLGPYGGLGKFELPEYLTALFPQFAERAGELAQPYALPEDIQKLMSGLATRGGEFLGRRPGYSDAVMRQMFGRDFERIRETGRRRGEEEMALARREGLAGTGAMRGAASDIAWQTEQDVTNLMRDLFLAGEEQKREDIYGYTGAAQDITDRLAKLRFGEEETGLARAGEARGLTGLIGQMLFGEEAASMGRLGYGTDLKRMAQNIFGQGMDYNKITEAINAARRGEQQNALSMILSYLFGMGNLWG